MNSCPWKSRLDNSKISGYLRHWFPKDELVYYSLVAHLAALGTGRASSMTGSKQKLAWQTITGQYGAEAKLLRASLV